MLGARAITPIHYGALHRPPQYVETSDPTDRLRAVADRIGIPVEIREPGEWLDLG